MIVDDIRVIITIFKQGVVFCQVCKVFREGRTQGELEAHPDETPTARTSRLIKEAMNCLEPELEFMSETCEEFSSNRLPTLDYQVWLEEQEGAKTQDQAGVEPDQELDPEVLEVCGDPHFRFPDPVPLTPREETCKIQETQTKNPGKAQVISYMYFEKEMSSKYCTLEKSAMSWNQKRSMLSQELIRRLLNTSEEVGKEVKDNIILGMSKRLKMSGYEQKQIRDIICSGLKGYKRKLGKGQERHRRG